DRVAALREAHEQVADALDPNAAGPRRDRRGSDGRQADLLVVDDAEPRDDLLGADRAVADRGVEVVERVHVVLLDDLVDLVMAYGLDALAGETPQLALKGLAAVD